MASEIALRKAFIAPLYSVVASYSPAVSASWPDGEPFDRNASGNILYVVPSLHAGPEIPRTLGPSPAVSQTGAFIILMGLRADQDQDILDTFADAVLAAYPWGVDLSAGGALVQIEQRSRGITADDKDGWLLKPAQINWSISL